MSFSLATCKKILNDISFTMKRKSPEILIVSGIVGLIGSGVMACIATTKVSKINKKYDEMIEHATDTYTKISEGSDEYVSDDGQPATYSEKEYSSDVRAYNIRKILHIGVLYLPAVAAAGISVAGILTGTGILKKRLTALGALYSAVATEYKEYRERVVERFGKETDDQLRYGYHIENVKKKITDENGKTKTITEETKVADDKSPIKHSPYARIFDEYCPGWTKDPGHNQAWLINMQNWANERLKTKGHLFLNEVYDAFNFDRTREGWIVGWTTEGGEGDHYVDFGLFNLSDGKAADFINGRERSFIMDFNVQGDIRPLALV